MQIGEQLHALRIRWWHRHLLVPAPRPLLVSLQQIDASQPDNASVPEVCIHKAQRC